MGLGCAQGQLIVARRGGPAKPLKRPMPDFARVARSSASCKCADAIEQRLLIVDPKPMVVSDDLNEPRAWDLGREEPPGLDAHGAVAGAVQTPLSAPRLCEQMTDIGVRNGSSTPATAPGLEAALSNPAHQVSAWRSPARLGAKVSISAGPPQLAIRRCFHRSYCAAVKAKG